MKSPAKEETEELQKEIEQLLTCLNIEKPAVSSTESSSKSFIDRVVKSRASEIPKYSSFNPFPSRSFNENVAVNGYKLGLYSPVVTSR